MYKDKIRNSYQR